ncbi:MAG: winged helix-turn-helix transcriptional regulator [Theionarchaea archaeon]|nr:winged helix-turn-helix transcriptional regulator [Theionarchaea archaeon]
MEDNLRKFLRVLGFTATVDILNSIEEGKNQYKHFIPFASISTLNERVKQLESLGIIEHHLAREDKRREWYTLTQKGEKVVKVITKLERVFQVYETD